MSAAADHPLVAAAIHALGEDSAGHLRALPDRLARLRTELEGYFVRPDLEDAVRALIEFAVYVGEVEKAREVAMSLLDVAAWATPALESRASAGRESVRRAQARAASFFAEPRAKSAPKLGDPAPAGSVALSTILAKQAGPKRG